MVREQNPAMGNLSVRLRRLRSSVEARLTSGLVRRSAAPGLSVLSEREARVLAAVADRVCPSVPEGHAWPTSRELVAQADAMAAAWSASRQVELKLALRFVESPLTGRLLSGCARPFSTLRAAEQAALLHALSESSVLPCRTIHRSLSVLCAALLYADPRTWPAIGFASPQPAKLREARRGQLVELRTLATAAARGGR
jgi:hypothetical protein